MNERAAAPDACDGDASPVRVSGFRLVLEFAVLFAVALLFKRFLVEGSAIPYPNPLWLPVVVLSLEHGLAAGLTAALIAAALQLSGGVPPPLQSEDLYAHVGRIAAEPIAWNCTALLIGHIRGRQIAEVTRLRAELAERTAHGDRVAGLCADLRERTEVLERRIAAGVPSADAEVAAAIRETNDATSDDCGRRPRLGLDRAPVDVLDVRPLDAPVALLTSAASFAVLAYGMAPAAQLRAGLLLHGAVLALPAIYLAIRARQHRDLTLPLLLLIATAAAGPIGALCCAGVAVWLRWRRPSPSRLQQWYDYISGVTARERIARLHDEMVAGRLAADPAAAVPHFAPIIEGGSLDDQQRVLGVIGRRYHAAFRPLLRRALRHRNGFIRAQAAAIASRLDPDERQRLQSDAPPRDRFASDRDAFDARGHRS